MLRLAGCARRVRQTGQATPKATSSLILARLNPTGYHELSRTNVIGPTWAHPAYAGDCVYARSDSEIVCVSLMEAAPPIDR